MEFPRLPERPEPHVLTVEDLVVRARTGRIRIPRLQRGYRWARGDILDLFDSIVRGYPLGSILVNQAAAPAEFIQLGSVALNVPEVADAWWLVDGQQRVTTLVAALLHPNADAGDRFAVWVNLRTAAFEAGRFADPDWLPLSVLGDRSRLLHWSRTVQIGPDTEALVDRAFELEKAVTQYKLTAFTVRNAPASTVRAIFGRVNGAGVPLRENEVVDALFGDDEHGKPLERLATDLDTASGFGRLDEAWLLRCVKAVGGHRPGQRFDERHQLSDELVARTRAALVRALAFLQVDAKVPHAAVLPYRLPLIVLATLFDRHPTLSDRSRELVVRWLWRGAASQEHARSSIADVVAYTTAIGGDEEGAVQAMLARVARDVITPHPFAGWNAKSAFSRLYACAMLTVPPLDPLTQEPVCGLALGPKETLSDRFQDPVGSGVIAGRVWWPRPIRELLEADPAVLASLGVDERRRDALAQGIPNGYVIPHGEWMQDVLERCLDGLGGRAADDRPSIGSILRRAQG